MTLTEIEAIDKEMLSCVDVAPLLRSDPASIRWQAHREPEKLGFPVVVLKNRVKIPKAAFLQFCRGTTP